MDFYKIIKANIQNHFTVKQSSGDKKAFLKGLIDDNL